MYNKNVFKKGIKVFTKVSAAMLILFSAFTLSSCASTEKSGYATCSNITYHPDTVNHKTEFKCDLAIENKSIYDMDGFYFYFYYYNGTTELGTTNKITLNYYVKHDSTGKTNFIFTVPNETATTFKFKAWNANFKSVWDSYKVWWIIGIVLLTILIAAAIIVTFVLGVTFTDLLELFY